MAATSLSLFVTHPTGERTEHLIRDGLKVGRLAEADVRVMSAFLSRVHFVIRQQADSSYVVESQHRVTASKDGMGRILGTYINKQLVAGTHPIMSGDRISPFQDPAPGDLVFEVGPTQSPTPSDQMPQPKKMGMGAVIALAAVLIAAIVYFVAFR